MKLRFKQLVVLTLILCGITFSNSSIVNGQWCPPNCKPFITGYKPFVTGYAPKERDYTLREFSGISPGVYTILDKKFLSNLPGSADGREIIKENKDSKDQIVIIWKGIPEAQWGKTGNCTLKEGSLITNRDRTINVTYTCKNARGALNPVPR
jgi:hypothetical protein